MQSAERERLVQAMLEERLPAGTAALWCGGGLALLALVSVLGSQGVHERLRQRAPEAAATSRPASATAAVVRSDAYRNGTFDERRARFAARGALLESPRAARLLHRSL